MACLTLASVIASCNSRGVGGLKNRILFANKSQISSISLSITPPNEGAVDGITMVTGARFWILDSVDLQGSGVSDYTKGLNAFFTQTINGTIRGGDQPTSNFLSDLVLGEFVFIVQTRTLNDEPTPESLTLLYGYENGLMLNTSSYGTGTALEDLLGATLSFTGAETEPHKEVIPSAGTIAAFLAALLIPAP